MLTLSRTHLQCDHRERIVYVSTEQLPDNYFAIKHDGILLPFVDETHPDPFPQHSDGHTRNTEANSEITCIDPEQSPVQTCIYCTPHLDNSLASKPISNKNFDIFDNEVDLWSLLSNGEGS